MRMGMMIWSGAGAHNIVRHLYCLFRVWSHWHLQCNLLNSINIASTLGMRYSGSTIAITVPAVLTKQYSVGHHGALHWSLTQMVSDGCTLSQPLHRERSLWQGVETLLATLQQMQLW